MCYPLPVSTRTKSTWMLYGAYGFTGRLLLAEAVRRGHRPVLAGRNAAKLATLATQYDLDWLALDLDYAERLNKTIERFTLVFHAAGPFIHTSEPMVRACLAGQTHYLDITGELPVFEATFARDAEARARGVVLMSGAGYDIVPSDCLARHVADRVPGATHLETALVALADLSSGTVKSALVNANRYPGGSLTRRDGRLAPTPLGKGRRKVRFSDGRVRDVTPFPWGDLVTAYHTTGIGNITTYLALPRLPGMGLLARPALKVMGLGAAQKVADRAATWLFTGPDEEAQRQGRTYLWAQASGPDGAAEAWLETGEVYRFTALAGVRLVERVLAAGKRDAPPLAGALTPAGAFGADFVLDIEGVRRFDSLP